MPCLFGCHAPPIVMRTGNAYGGSALTSRAAALWRCDEPGRALNAGSRVAILECSVEFVTMKQVTPGDNQPMVGGPIGAASALMDLSGVFRKRVTYPSDVLLDFPREVHEAVVFILEENGMTVADPGDVVSTRGYKHLVRSPVEHSMAAYHLNPKGSDAGRVNEFSVYPSWPLRVLHERSDSLIETAERAVRMELAADATLRVRLRVGIYHGRASIEQGSEILITTGDWQHRVASDRSAVSGRLVGSCEDYELVAGQEYTVDWPAFRDVLRGMLPAYLAAGLPVDDGAMRASTPADRASDVRAVSMR